jgi:hypothetical protein
MGRLNFGNDLLDSKVISLMIIEKLKCLKIFIIKFHVYKTGHIIQRDFGWQSIDRMDRMSNGQFYTILSKKSKI